MLRCLVSVTALITLRFSAGSLAADAPALHAGDTLAICGDSITEQKMYSVYMEDYLLMCKPAGDVRSMQFGWSGDTSWGFLANKLDDDVLRFHPTVATTCFGMNDGGYSKLTDGVAERYRASTQTIIDKFKSAGVHTIIIGSPGCVGDELRGKPAHADVYNQTLMSLRDIDKELAEKNGVIFADVFTPMMDMKTKAQAKYGPKYLVAGPDGIHPSNNGHLVMAYAFLKAMGFNGDIGTITIDMATGKASSTDGHKLNSDTVKDGTVEIDSSRYPFCFAGDPTRSDATTGIIEFLPFNQDLNRFTLIVKNAKAEKLKVTWGSSSREYAAGDLAKGINLAADFLDNPFCAQFEKVHAAVKAQQAFETPFVKTFVANIPSFEQMVGVEDKSTFTHLADSGGKKDQGLFNTAAAMVTPVHHSIKIEAVN